MKHRTLVCAAIVCQMVLTLQPAVAQDKGSWRPASKTAESITGELDFSNDRISIDLSSFALAQIRVLKPEEAAALFDGSAPGGRGNLYRFRVPAAKRFVHRNTLCGDQDAQWVATYVTGHDLQVALFSGEAMPLLTPESLANTTDLCGTFSYVR